MYRTVLVPLDGSPFAEDSLPMAVNAAREFGAQLHLSHVMDFMVTPPYARKIAPGDWWNGRGAEFARAYLEMKVAPLRAEGLEVSTSVRVGPAGPGLLREIRDYDADLVIMSTHGRGPLGRFWLGNVADCLTRESPCPVLLRRVHEQPANQTRNPDQFAHILVPLDGSEISEHAIGHAHAFARLHGGRVTLLHIASPVPGPALPFALGLNAWVSGGFLVPEDGEGSPTRHPDQATTVDSVEVTREFLVSRGPTGADILDYSDSHDVDLIVMTTHGRSGVARMVLGSVTDKIVRGSRAPVLVIPPRAA